MICIGYRVTSHSQRSVWRADLFGGGRVLGFVDRLYAFRTLAGDANDPGLGFGEGFIEGKSGKLHESADLSGKIGPAFRGQF